MYCGSDHVRLRSQTAASGAVLPSPLTDGGSSAAGRPVAARTASAVRLPLILLTVLVCLLYHGVALKLVNDWYELPDFSHGFLIPFFVAYLLWEKRTALRHTLIEPSWEGLPLVVCGLFLLLVGIFGADLFLSRISFLLLAAGLVWTLAGRAMLAQLRFSLFVLLLAIPLPALV